MDFYDLIRQRPCQTHYAVEVDGIALTCPVELGHGTGRARCFEWANANDWLTHRPGLGYLGVMRSVMDRDGDVRVELEGGNGQKA